MRPSVSNAVCLSLALAACGRARVESDIDTRPNPPDRGATDTRVRPAAPRDAGAGGVCPSRCSTNDECGSTCRVAPSGFVNCCLGGQGGGICYEYMGVMCPSTGDADRGERGCFATPCTSQADCDSACGPGHRCFVSGGAGFCI